MSFAPHSNSDVRSNRDLPVVLGFFRERESDAPFEFANRKDFPESFAPDMPHMIWASDGTTRLAHVKKTFAYVVVDEADDGGPCVEKWSIKNFAAYDTKWIDEK